MAVCGCGESLVGSPPILTNGFDDLGIIITGTFDNTIITTAGASAWRPFTPTLTNFTVGNGTMNARYLANGYNIDAIVSIAFGSTSTWAASTFQVELPWSPRAGIHLNHGTLGVMSIFDSSASSPWYQGSVVPLSSGNVGFRFGDDLGGTNSLVQQGTPITFAPGDELSFQTRFEAISI